MDSYNVEEKLNVTTIDDLRGYAQGAIVKLPPFGEGQPFIARMRRPSLMFLIKTGKIPNSLISQATSLFAKGNNSLATKEVDVKELMDITEAIAEASMIEPSYQDIKNAGIQLSDDQLMAIFSYTQQGVKALENFRD